MSDTKIRRKKKNYSLFLRLTQNLKKEVAPDKKLSRNANEIINSLINILIKNVAANASLLLKSKKQKTVKDKTIIAAISIMGDDVIKNSLTLVNDNLNKFLEAAKKIEQGSEFIEIPMIYHKAPRVLKHLKNYMVCSDGRIRYGKYVGAALGSFIDSVVRDIILEASAQTTVTSSRGNKNTSITIKSEHIKRGIAESYLWILFPRTYLPGASIPNIYEEIKKTGTRKSPVKKASAKRKSPVKKAPAKRKSPAKKAPAKRKSPAKKAPAKRKSPAKKAPAKRKSPVKKRVGRKKIIRKANVLVSES